MDFLYSDRLNDIETNSCRQAKSPVLQGYKENLLSELAICSLTKLSPAWDKEASQT